MKRACEGYKFVVTCAIVQHATPVPLAPATKAPTPATITPPPTDIIPGFSTGGRPWKIHDPARMAPRDKRGIRGPGTTDEDVLADEEATAREEAAREAARKTAEAAAPAPGGSAKARGVFKSLWGGAGTATATGAVAPATRAVGRAGRFFGLKGSWDSMDGVWDCTWDAGVEKGFDVVIYVIYFRM